MGAAVRRMEKVLGSLPQDQGRILGPEPYAITDGMLDLSAATDVRHVIQIALRIRDIEIDGGRNFAVFHGHQCGSEAGGAAGALRVSNL